MPNSGIEANDLCNVTQAGLQSGNVNPWFKSSVELQTILINIIYLQNDYFYTKVES